MIFLDTCVAMDVVLREHKERIEELQQFRDEGFVFILTETPQDELRMTLAVFQYVLVCPADVV